MSVGRYQGLDLKRETRTGDRNLEIVITYTVM
jgi:hypothetical protein